MIAGSSFVGKSRLGVRKFALMMERQPKAIAQVVQRTF
jgi:hypothetical protein